MIDKCLHACAQLGTLLAKQTNGKNEKGSKQEIKTRKIKSRKENKKK